MIQSLGGRGTTAPSASTGQVEALLADTGYFSEANVEHCEAARIVPLIPEKREQHNLPLAHRYQGEPAPPQNPKPVQAMRHRLQTQEGKGLYAKRKSYVETVFGIIKHVQGCRGSGNSCFGV